MRRPEKEDAAEAMEVAYDGKETVDEGNVTAFRYVFNSRAAVIPNSQGDGHATPINPALV